MHGLREQKTGQDEDKYEDAEAEEAEEAEAAAAAEAEAEEEEEEEVLSLSFDDSGTHLTRSPRSIRMELKAVASMLSRTP